MRLWVCLWLIPPVARRGVAEEKFCTVDVRAFVIVQDQIGAGEAVFFAHGRRWHKSVDALILETKAVAGFSRK